MEKYLDIRNLGTLGKNLDISSSNEIINEELLISFEFNERTKFPKNMRTSITSKQLLEIGKEPPLNIKSIHEQNITGQGITVAIIDQPLNLNHPEYKDKIISYKIFDNDINANSSSMHGPAVTSLLVGNNIGVAPDSKIIYAAVPSWKRDAIYEVKALEWIIEENRKRDKNNKIKVVSVSAAPNSKSIRDKNTELWLPTVQKALNEGILVLDCSEDLYDIAPCYNEINNYNNIETLKPGFPDNDYFSGKNCILVPCSRRTVAEIYEDNVFSYTYCGVGGLSWGIPYLAGLLALAWQINNNLTHTEIMNYIIETSYKKDNNFYVYPENFIDLVIKNTNGISFKTK